MLAIAILASLASAAVELSSGATGTNITVDVTYANLDEDDDDTEQLNFSKDITFQNTGNATENVVLTLSNIAAEHQLRLSETTFSLNASASKTITLTATVPVDENSGSQAIGTLSFAGLNYAVNSNVKSMLEIDEIDTEVNGEGEDSLNNDGDEIKKVRPGSEVRLLFNIRNLFDKDYRYGDIDDIELTLELKNPNDDDDFGDDLDEDPEDEFESLDAGQEVSGDDVIISFTVPVDAEEDDYELLLHLEGRDKNGAKHKEEWTLILEVDRKNDDVQFETVELLDSSLSCGQTTSLKIVLTNYGSNNQRKAAVSVYNEELGINENYVGISLDSDPDDDQNSFTRTIPILITEETGTGDYHIDVRSFIKDDELMEYKDVKLTVEPGACPGATTLGEEDNETTTSTGEGTLPGTSTSGGTTAPEPTAEPTPTGGLVVQTIEEPYTKEDFFIAVLIVASALILALIIIFVVLLVRR